MQPRALGQNRARFPSGAARAGASGQARPSHTGRRSARSYPVHRCLPLAAEHWDQMEAHGVHVIVFGGLCDEDLGHGITHSG